MRYVNNLYDNDESLNKKYCNLKILFEKHIGTKWTARLLDMTSFEKHSANFMEKSCIQILSPMANVLHNNNKVYEAVEKILEKIPKYEVSE